MRELKPCGTLAAYRRHLRRGELTCSACCAAYAAWRRDRERAKRAERGYVRGPYGTPQCGTCSGYMRHRYVGEETCQPCRDAMAAYTRDRKARKNAEAA